jgi:hypothetical protein
MIDGFFFRSIAIFYRLLKPKRKIGEGMRWGNKCVQCTCSLLRPTEYDRWLLFQINCNILQIVEAKEKDRRGDEMGEPPRCRDAALGLLVGGEAAGMLVL